MRKQKIKKISAKLFLAVFIINTICIFGFSTSALAAGAMNIDLDINQGRPATYNFDSDATGSDPSGWTVIEQWECYVDIQATTDLHYKYARLYDNGLYGVAQMFNTFTDQSSGTIEFYLSYIVYSWEISKGFIDIFSGNTLAIRFEIGKYQWGSNIYPGFWYNGGYTTYINLGNNFNHIRVDFDCDTDTLNLYINQVLIGSGIVFNNAVDTIDKIQFSTAANPRFELRVDAVGYSWDPNYNVGDNLKEVYMVEGDSITIDWNVIEHATPEDNWYYFDYSSTLYLKNNINGELQLIGSFNGLGHKSYTYKVPNAGRHTILIEVYTHWRNTWVGGSPNYGGHEVTETGNFYMYSDESYEFLVKQLLYGLNANPQVIHQGEQTTISWNVNPKIGVQDDDLESKLSWKFEDDNDWTEETTKYGTGQFQYTTTTSTFNDEGKYFIKVDLCLNNEIDPITSEETSITLIPLPKIPIGGSNRRFPSGSGTRLGYSMQTIDSFEDVNPKIYFGISQDSDFSMLYNVEINLLIDGIVIQSYFENIYNYGIFERTYEVEDLKIPIGHQIEMKIFYEIIDQTPYGVHILSNNDLFTLEYLKIEGLYFMEINETYLGGPRYTPGYTWAYGEQYDGMTVSMNTRYPLSKDGIYISNTPDIIGFDTAIMFFIDPDYEECIRPDLDYRYTKYYLDTLEVQWKVILPNGISFLWSMNRARVNPYDIGEEIELEYRDVLGDLADFIITVGKTVIALASSVGGKVIAFIDTVANFLTMINPKNEGDHVNTEPDWDAYIDDDTNGGYWKTGYIQEYDNINCPYSRPNPALDYFSMVLPWGLDVNGFNVGAYQVQMTWKADIHKYYNEWDEILGPVPGMEDHHELAFTKTGNYYFNFEVVDALA